MSLIEQQKTEAPPEEPVTRDPQTPTAPKRSRTIVLLGALLVALMILAGLVLVAGGGDGDKASTAAPKPAPAPAAAKPAAAAAPAAAANIGVTLKEFTVAPAPATGRAGTVTFRVHNAGAISHEFVVLRTNKGAADLLKGGEASEAGNVGEIGGLKPGVTKTLRLNLKAGHYALICNLPGHYVAGQRADLVVK
jgi:uncharacterized cupredoxin-like copper-binding protein